MAKQWVADSAFYLAPRGPGQGVAWQEDAARQGHTGTSRINAVTETQPPEDVASWLNLGDGLAVLRRRTMYLDGEPVELADSYYPATIARGTRLADPRKIPGGATTLLASLGYRPAEVDEYVTTEKPTPGQRTQLNLPVGESTLVVKRVVSAADGTPFECSVMTMVASATLTYHTQVDP